MSAYRPIIHMGAFLALLVVVAAAPCAHARSISGRVTDGATGNPISGATVTAISTAGSYSDSQTTDSDGYYFINSLPPAPDFGVSAVFTGYLQESYATTIDLTRFDAAGIDFALSLAPPPTPRTISGRVVAEGTMTGIAGIQVGCYSLSGATPTAETDANGYYTLTGLNSLYSEVFVYTAQSSDYVHEVYEDVAYPGDAITDDLIHWAMYHLSQLEGISLVEADAANIDFELAAARTVSGRVVDESTMSGIAGAQVTISSVSTGADITVTTDADGYYVRPNLPIAGDCIVKATMPGYYAEWYNDAANAAEATAVDLTAGHAANIDLALTIDPGPVVYPRTISGRVVREGTDEGIPGITVRAVKLGFVESCTTDQNGYYQVTGLDSTLTDIFVATCAAYYQNEIYDNIQYPSSDVSAWMEQDISGALRWLTVHMPSFHAFNLASGDVENVNFELGLSRSISGRVVEEGTNTGIAGARIEVTSPSSDYRPFTTCDSEGYYLVVSLIPLADYTVRATATGFVASSLPADVTAGDVTGVNLSLQSESSVINPRTISGRVVYEGTSTGIANLRVVAINLEDLETHEAVTDAGGYYVLTGFDSTASEVSLWTASPYFMNEVYPDVYYQGPDLLLWMDEDETEFFNWYSGHYFEITRLNLTSDNATGVDFSISGDRFILLPHDGASVAGTEVTVAARLAGSALPSIQSVQFQFKAETDSSWADIPSSAYTPNPDTSQPFFVYWNTTSLPAGNYNLRAVVTELDQDQFSDLPITVTVGAPAPELTEMRNGEGRHEIAAPVSATATEDIRLGGGDATTSTVADLVLSPSALTADTTVRIIFPDTSALNGLYVSGNEGVDSANIFLQVTLDSGQSDFENGQEAILNVEYADANQDGFVDGINAAERGLRMLYYNTVSGAWAPLSYTGIDTFSNVLHAKTTHFTTFGGLNVDTDSDGIPDNVEDANSNGIVDPDETDPADPDSDGDGVSDGLEVQYGYDPLDPGDTPELPVTDTAGLHILVALFVLAGMIALASRAVVRNRG